MEIRDQSATPHTPSGSVVSLASQEEEVPSISCSGSRQGLRGRNN